MKNRRMIPVVALAGLFAAACAPQAEEQVELERDPAARGAHELPGAPPATLEGAAAMHVDTLADGAEYLTDGSRRALYLLADDPQGQSLCYEGCAEVWPPFLASPEATPRAGAEAVRTDLIGTLQRRDGTTQVTYAGQALYYFQEDAGPGDVRGQARTDAWGEWYLVQPRGGPVEEHRDEPGS